MSEINNSDNGEGNYNRRDRSRPRRSSSKGEPGSELDKAWEELKDAHEKIIRNLARQEVQKKHRETDKEVRLKSEEKRSGSDGLFRNVSDDNRPRKDMRQRIQEEKKHLEELKDDLQKEKRRREQNLDYQREETTRSTPPKTSQQHQRTERDVQQTKRQFSDGFLESRSKIEAFLIGLGTGIVLAFLIGIILGPVLLIG